MNDIQQKIQNLLDQMVEQNRETGVQAAAFYRGELVVDACAGFADADAQTPVTGATLFPVFSTTKGVLATIVHRLAARQILDYDAPISSYWPQFGARGKTNITLRHALTHTSGLPYMPAEIGPGDEGNWELMCRVLADATPAYEPGERTEYHAITWSWLVGETACRAANRSFAQLWRDEICAPLGVENEMFCGLPADLDDAVAALDDSTAAPADSHGPQAIPARLYPLGRWMNHSAPRRAQIPASNGIMSARAIARHYAALLPGGAGGLELLTPARVAMACQPNVAADGESNFGLGYMLKLFDAPQTFGHPGYGGSVGLADRESGWALGFARNRFGDGDPARVVWDALMAARGA